MSDPKEEPLTLFGSLHRGLRGVGLVAKQVGVIYGESRQIHCENNGPLLMKDKGGHSKEWLSQ